jgi:hypothetical protein
MPDLIFLNIFLSHTCLTVQPPYRISISKSLIAAHLPRGRQGIVAIQMSDQQGRVKGQFLSPKNIITQLSRMLFGFRAVQQNKPGFFLNVSAYLKKLCVWLVLFNFDICSGF